MSTSILDVVFLDKGYSSDRKFILCTKDGARYLLRTSDLADEARRRTEFDNLEIVWRSGVRCPEPLGFGVDGECSVCYMLLTYICGECAEDSLKGLPPAKRYAVGCEAAEELLKIHRAIEPAERVEDSARIPFRQRPD